MFTSKDIQYRSIFVINCIKDRNLRVSNGELLLEEADEKKTLTKMPFQKILALFVIGHITVTTPLIDKCKKYNVALIVVKRNLRPVFFWNDSAEANFLLRQRQHNLPKDDMTAGKALLINKISNQKALLIKTRKKDNATINAINICDHCMNLIVNEYNYQSIMGLEGIASKSFFSAYFQDYNWASRRPRAKIDPMNVTLDIGYSILFNFIECFLRMFGFDLYVGVFHRLWFKRKSLVCDIMEPFRCIIEHAVRNAYKLKQFKTSDFKLQKEEYVLKHEVAPEYYKFFMEALVKHKMEIFKYVQSYYRCFMRQVNLSSYPQFQL